MSLKRSEPKAHQFPERQRRFETAGRLSHLCRRGFGLFRNVWRGRNVDGSFVIERIGPLAAFTWLHVALVAGIRGNGLQLDRAGIQLRTAITAEVLIQAIRAPHMIYTQTLLTITSIQIKRGSTLEDDAAGYYFTIWKRKNVLPTMISSPSHNA